MSDFMPIAMPSGHSSDPPDVPALKLRQFAWLATAKRRKVVTISGIVGFVGLSVLMGFTVRFSYNRMDLLLGVVH
jgi:hypothetical protein